MGARSELSCPLCDSAAARMFGGERVVDSGHQLCVCSSCGAGFLSPQPSDRQLEEAYASEYYGADGAKFRPLLEQAMALFARRFAHELAAHLPRECTRVLDVGCGRGLLVRALLDAHLEVHGVERSLEATRGIDARAHVHIAARLADAELEPASFGAIVWRHVLEHVRDPVEELVASRGLLHDDGVLVIEVPHFGGAQARFGGARWFHLDPPRHLFHFTEGALRALLGRTGFDVVDVARASWAQDPMGWVQSALHHAGRPRDGFFEMLKRGGKPALVDAALGISLVPAAIGASAVDAAFFGGGTLLVRARKAR